MALNSKLAKDFRPTSGNLNTLVAGTITGGATLSMQDVQRGTLSARFTVEAETDTIQIEAIWQVSHDNCTTWREVLFPWVLATGTGADDDPVELVSSAPDAVYAHLHVRAAVRNTVVTGATVDTWAIDYSYERKSLA